MPEIREIARVSELPKVSNIPDVDDPEQLMDAARAVYEAVKARIHLSTSFQRTNLGAPGHMWQGKIVSDIIYAIWPDLDKSYLVPRDKDIAIRDALFTYLFQSNALSCKQKGTKYADAQWWVNDHWTPIETRQVAEDPQEPEAEKASPVSDVLCPTCGAAFDALQKMASHLKQSHRAVLGADGTVWVLDENFTDEVMDAVVLGVVEEAGRPLTMNGLADRAKKRDPRMALSLVQTSVVRLLGAPQSGFHRVSNPGSWDLFSVKCPSGDATPVLPPIEAVSPTAGAVRNVVPRNAAPVVPSSLPEAERYGAVLVAAKKMIGDAAEAFERLHERLAELESALAVAKRELAAARQRLIAAGSSSETAKLKAAIADLQQELAQRTRERDTAVAGRETAEQKVADVYRVLGIQQD